MTASLTLKPQEPPYAHPDSSCRFSGNLVATPAAIASFGFPVIICAHLLLQREAKTHDGIDYLQVFERKDDGERLWFIDDGSHVTALLPSDY